MTHKYNSYQSCDDESHIHPYKTNAQAIYWETLKIIDAISEDIDNESNRLISALKLAIAEHAPMDGYCYQCMTNNGSGEIVNVTYPCKTIKVITRELNKCQYCHNPVYLKPGEEWNPEKDYENQRVHCSMCEVN